MPVPDMKPVFSSHVAAMGYDDGTLYVQWTTGRVSAYEGVPEDLADKVTKSWSIGDALRTDIKGQYGHRYVE